MNQIEFTPNYKGLYNITYTSDKETFTIVNPSKVKAELIDNKIHIFITSDSKFVESKELITDVKNISNKHSYLRFTKDTTNAEAVDIINDMFRAV